jgi:hypothetical protein
MTKEQAEKIHNLLVADLKASGYDEEKASTIMRGATYLLFSFMISDVPMDDPLFVESLECTIRIIKIINNQQEQRH